MKKLLSIALIAAISGVFNTESSASVLDDKFQDCGGASADFSQKFTLDGHQTPIFEATDLDSYDYKIFNAPCIDTYDVNGWGIQPKFAANVSLPAHARARLQRLLGQDIADGTTFQFIIQKSNSYYDTKDTPGTSNGGINQGQQEPISLKAQYVYTPCVPGNGWFGSTIDEVDHVQSYIVHGDTIFDGALIEDGGCTIYPQRRADLSLHSAGASSTLSPDTFHLYRGGAEKPATLDTDGVYPTEAYDRLIKNEDKTKALLYKTQYENWTRKVSRRNDLGSIDKTTPLPKEADRYGMIVMLSDADFDQFVNAINRNATLREAISPIGLFSQEVNGVRLMDLFENADRVMPFIPQNLSPKEAAKLQKQQGIFKKKAESDKNKAIAAAAKDELRAEAKKLKDEKKSIASENRAKQKIEKKAKNDQRKLEAYFKREKAKVEKNAQNGIKRENVSAKKKSSIAKREANKDIREAKRTAKSATKDAQLRVKKGEEVRSWDEVLAEINGKLDETIGRIMRELEKTLADIDAEKKKKIEKIETERDKNIDKLSEEERVEKDEISKRKTEEIQKELERFQKERDGLKDSLASLLESIKDKLRDRLRKIDLWLSERI